MKPDTFRVCGVASSSPRRSRPPGSARVDGRSSQPARARRRSRTRRGARSSRRPTCGTSGSTRCRWRRTPASIIGHLPDVGVHPDFGSFQGYGIPINVVAGTQKRKHVRSTTPTSPTTSATRSPSTRRSSAAPTAHMLIVDRGHCRLYELFAAHKTASGWHAGSGATWSLLSNHLRPKTWTSADAAGLPILPGLVRWNEVKKGVIDHALRFTVPTTCTHLRLPRAPPGRLDQSDCTDYPRMGERFRLRSDFPVNTLPRQARVIAIAMQRYGIIVADNGTEWYVQGASNSHFNDDGLHDLNRDHRQPTSWSSTRAPCATDKCRRIPWGDGKHWHHAARRAHSARSRHRPGRGRHQDPRQVPDGARGRALRGAPGHGLRPRLPA